MNRKLGVIMGVLITLSTVVILWGSQGAKSKDTPKNTSRQKEVKKVSLLVERYQKYPLSLRKYGKAFYDLGRKRWHEKDLKDAAEYFGTAVKIYDNIIRVQNRRPSSEKKLRSYRLLSRSLTEARLKSLFAKCQVLLELNKRKEALGELINIARFCGHSTEFPENEGARKLLQKEFYLAEDDMRDLGIESLK